MLYLLAEDERLLPRRTRVLSVRKRSGGEERRNTLFFLFFITTFYAQRGYFLLPRQWPRFFIGSPNPLSHCYVASPCIDGICHSPIPFCLSSEEWLAWLRLGCWPLAFSRRRSLGKDHGETRANIGQMPHASGDGCSYTCEERANTLAIMTSRERNIFDETQ